jgi:hypothetical protein
MAKTVKPKTRVGAKRPRSGSQASKSSSAKVRGATRASKKSSRASIKKSSRASTSVMGVRVPPTLKNALDSLVNSERGREILASALVAAATAAAAALVKSSDSSQPAKARIAAADVGEQVGEATKDVSELAGGVVADLVTGAVRSLLPKSR